MSAVSSHLQRLGFERNPFPPSPDASHYFYTGLLEQEFSEALHCLLAGKGFVLLSGEVGMGKSTFVRRLIGALSQHSARVALVFNTFLQGSELLNAIVRDFGLEPGANIADNIDRLNHFLIEQHVAGFACVLLIDDAQNLSLESLELVRLLTNLETGQEKLLQIVLAGQPELQESLARPQIRQLASRIVKHLHLEPLGREETGRYVEFRLAKAGAGGRVHLSADGLRKLMSCSGGNPRLIHLIMDRCLYGVLLRPDGLINGELVGAAAREAGFRPVHVARSRKRLPMSLAAALVLGCGALAFSQWPGDDAASAVLEAPAAAAPPVIVAEPVAPVIVAAAPAPAVEAPARPDVWQQCIAQLGVSPDVSYRSFAVASAQLPGVLEQGACLLQAGDPALVLWRPHLRGEAIVRIQANDDALRLQQALTAQGLYRGQPDGLWGPLTSEALALFQSRQGLPPTGVPDDLTLSLLPASAAVPTTSAASPRPSAAEPNKEPAYVEG